MGLTIPTSVPLPPIAQALAEAALQRQGTLLEGTGASPPAATGTAGQLAASWSAATPAPAPLPTAAPAPVPGQAEATQISAQAREALGAGFDPRGAAALTGKGAQAAGLAGPSTSPPAGTGAPGAVPAGAAGAAGAATWPAAGLTTPQRQMVQTLVAQLTAQVGPQRVVAAQAWPLALAHALESGAEGGENAPLQTWLVRQGTVLTTDGPRGLTATLRVPTSWLAAQAAQTTQSASPAAAGTGALLPSGALQAPFTGPAQNLQSGVLALLLQGTGPAAVRTSALLVLDFQPQLATAGAAVYGRDMLQARLDPWLQLAQLQASGQLPRDEDLARDREAGLCQAPGCPYALRAPCAQPFCLEMRVGAPGASMAVLDAPPGRAAPDPAL